VSDREYNSPACSLHEVERLAPPKSTSWEDVKAWRRLQRDALIKARPQDANERLLRSKPILDKLSAELRAIGAVPQSSAARLAEGRLPILGIYWPFRSEIDVRDLAHRHIEAGGIVALPVVVEKNAAVEFWRWRPEVPMSRGLFNIPIPAEREIVAPDVLIEWPFRAKDVRVDRHRAGEGGPWRSLQRA